MLHSNRMTPTPPHSQEVEPFFPYADLDDAPSDVRRLLGDYADRMGFLPNALKLYLHRPHILKQIVRLNNTVMRHSSNVLSEAFKYRMSFIISRNHGCRYCCTHHAVTLRNKFGCSDEDLIAILSLANPTDEREEVAWAFVDAASRGAEHVTDDMRKRLTDVFTPEEIIEIAATLGFWAFYNRIHASLAVPVEEHLLADSHWVDFQPGA